MLEFGSPDRQDKMTLSPPHCHRLEEFLEFILYGLPAWISMITTLVCCLKDNNEKKFEPSDNVEGK